jgi:hypothetical protein
LQFAIANVDCWPDQREFAIIETATEANIKCGGLGRSKMSEAVAAPSVAAPTVNQIYKVALASIIGSVIEQYDFLVTA